MGAPRHCERSETIHLSTRHSSEALAAPVAESAVSTIDGFGGRGTWKSASEHAALAMTVEAFVVLRSVRHHIEFESKRRSASGSRPGHKRAQG